MPVTAPGVGRTAGQILADTARITDPALTRVVDRLSSPLRETVYYHYGWAGKGGGPATGVRGGTGRKGIAFTLLCASVDGGPAECGLPAVVAGNLLMNVATLHDDIVDLEARRRGRPTVLAAYSTGHAVMAGDALLALAFSHLALHPHPRTQDALRIMREGWLHLCAGQVRDEQHEGNCETSLEQAVAVQAAKTAEGVRAVCCLPALLTDASLTRVEAVGRFGWHLGMAVQHHNDLSDLWPARPPTRDQYGDIRRKQDHPHRRRLPAIRPPRQRRPGRLLPQHRQPRPRTARRHRGPHRPVRRTRLDPRTKPPPHAPCPPRSRPAADRLPRRGHPHRHLPGMRYRPWGITREGGVELRGEPVAGARGSQSTRVTVGPDGLAHRHARVVSVIVRRISTLRIRTLAKSMQSAQEESPKFTPQ
ncbi:polyprenyl synthetase family protein [Streptomyces sp. NPDC020983]|uniref:polyprenyl synthetase family protein n=1 Tax=Streptomyces sp. NPDC020983 TaxID=3365106 RepID=UPI00378E3058